MNVIVRNIPNSITCLNLIAGVTAIIFLMESPDSSQSWQPWMSAAICIAIASVADFCDGFAARLLKAYSNMGKELDSLCDLVSFGVAPSLMVYRCFFAHAEMQPAAWLAIFIAVCGALRLARFNVDDRQSSSFIGLPIPANAIFWIGFTSIFASDAELLGLWPVLLIILVVSLLMLLPLPIESLKFKTWGWKGNEKRWLLIVAFIASVAIFGVPGLMWGIVAYILISLLPLKNKS